MWVYMYVYVGRKKERSSEEKEGRERETHYSDMGMASQKSGLEIITLEKAF